MMKLKGLSLFSNVGIAEIFFEKIGIDILIANEIDDTRAKFYKENYPNTDVIIGDIKKKKFFDEIINKSKKNKIDFIITTPPCQGMSNAGKKDKKDPRNTLINEAIKVIREIKPKYVFLENVPQQLNTFVRYNNEEILIPNYLRSCLKKYYNFSSNETVNAAHYSVPQNRTRSIILLTRKDLKNTWNPPKRHKKIITLETEHKCIIESASYAADCGIEVVKLKVNADGVLDLKNLDAELKIKPAIVSIMAVNNETGVIQDMASIGELCERYYSYLHTDAAQAIGRIPLDVKEMNIMAMSISGHKFYGPKGIGIFFIDRTIKNLIKPLIRGGGQEFRLRSGTLPTPLCVGIGHAIELAVKNIQSDQATCSKLNNLFLNKLKDSNPEIKINGSINKRIKDNLNIRIPGIYSEQLIANVPEVAFSTGSACTSGQIETSHVLRAMGLDDKQARESFRISFNKMLSEKQAFDAADFIIRGCSKLRNI